MKILCVEDDRNIAQLLEITLNKQHHQVDLAHDGQAGWNLGEIYPYDLIILDVMLPKLDGINFCKRLRNNQILNPNRNTPIILMTALDAVTNKVIGLDAGADDYLTKPFDVNELLARMRALLRRNQAQKTPLLIYGDLCLNPNSCEVTYQEKPIYLAAKEYEILELFLRHPNKLFSAEYLLDRLWTADEFPAVGSVRVHIKNLRQKLKQAGVTEILETIYKQGYRLKQRMGSQEAEGRRQEAVVESREPLTEEVNIASELKTVWEKYHQSYCERLAIIQQAITALKNRTLTPAQKQKAEQEAHTLIGSLGCLGLDKASIISRQIQQLLKQQRTLESSEIEHMQQLATDLQQDILQYNGENQASEVLRVPTVVSGRLLIVEDDLTLAKEIATEATNWGWQAEIAVNLEQAEQMLAAHSYNVMLLDICFPDSGENGLDFLVMIHDEFPEISILMLTENASFPHRVDAARRGSQSFLQKPILPSQILATVTQVVQQKNQAGARLLIVDDDPVCLDLLRTLLEPSGYNVTLLEQPDKFWETLEQTMPDLLILDVEFSLSEQDKVSVWSGFDLCQIVRSDIRWNRLPILFLSSHIDNKTIQQSFTVGADDFLTKPIIQTELLTRVRTRLEQRQLWKVTEIDSLTGVNLRHKGLQDLTRLLQLTLRQEKIFSLALLDLDHFKSINDQYGHKMGDRVLNYFGQLLNQSFRREDVLVRWGGDEFMIGMYGIGKEDARKRLEQVLQQLSQYLFTTQQETGETEFRVTFTGGIAQSPDDGKDLQTLYQKADAALYQAKALGRNRICS